jgi:hypothetical protein
MQRYGVYFTLATILARKITENVFYNIFYEIGLPNPVFLVRFKLRNSKNR